MNFSQFQGYKSYLLKVRHHFFSLVKKEKFTSDELEQDGYAELPHQLLSRILYAVLVSYNIPEMREETAENWHT